MQIVRDGIQYTLKNDIRDNASIRASFNQLAQTTFGLSFENWYQQGYWANQYIPYVLMDGDRVVSNVSVNVIDTIWRNEKKRYIQLGTIMTDSEYKGRGLSRLLMERVLSDWENQCDAIYLFANDSVLDFYPKFGFKKADEYQCRFTIAPSLKRATRLDMSKAADRELLLEIYKNSNPFSALPMVDNMGLLMFYCAQYMKEHVYYVEEYQAIVIADHQNESLLCYDIFCDGNQDMNEILAAIAIEETTTVLLRFSPKSTANCIVERLQEEDTTLFILSSKENIFAQNQCMFPLLSHA